MANAKFEVYKANTAYRYLVPRGGGDAMIAATRKLRRYLAIAGLVIALSLIAGACGSSKSSSSPSSVATGSATSATPSHVRAPKTKFVLHAGLAFGAFHRWIYKPLRAGAFAHPLSHKAAVVKGGLAGAFTYHELKLALRAAQADKTLSHLVAPITALQNKINGVTTGLKQGHVDAAQINSANGSIASIHSQSAAAGQPITEQTPNSP